MKNYFWCFILVPLVLSCKTVSVSNNNPLDNIVLVSGDTLFGKVNHIKEGFVISEFYHKIRLTDTNGRKRKFKRKNVKSFRVNRANYESFTLQTQNQIFKNGRLFNTKYQIDKNGQQHFLKVVNKGKLLHYELEWIDIDNNYIRTEDLVKKDGDSFFTRADNGISGINKTVMRNYLKDCPEIQDKLSHKDFKWVFQMVDFYNKNCD